MSQMGGEVIDCIEWILKATNKDTDNGKDDGTQVNESNSTNGPLLQVP
jgi:hypothetical protein